MYGIEDVALGHSATILFGNGEVWGWGGYNYPNAELPSPLLFNGQPIRHGWKLDSTPMATDSRTIYTKLGQVIHTVFKSGLGAENKEITSYYDELCILPETP